jgi:hypothetical protein
MQYGVTSCVPLSLTSIHALHDFEPQKALLHPAHRQQIVESFERPVPNAVMRPPGDPQIMGNGNFDDRESFQLEERGQETMPAFEEFDVGDALALERALTRARV